MSTLDRKIAHAAIRLLSTVGHKNATTRRIAQEAGISQSTIFRLYGDKNKLLLKIFHDLHPDGRVPDLSTLLGEEDVAAGLAHLFQAYLAVIVAYLPAVRLSMQLGHDVNFRTDPDIALGPYIDQLTGYFQNLCAQNRIIQADFRALSQLVFAQLLTHAPRVNTGDDGEGCDEAISGLAWKYALFLERKLRTGRNAASTTGFLRRRENRSSDIRENNLRAMLRAFMDAERLSASEVQKDIHLSKTTIIKLISQLLEDGLLLDLGVDNSLDERGRPPSYYRINSDFGYGVVIQFAPDSILTAVINMNNEIIHIYPTPITDELSFDEALSIIVGSFHHVLDSLGIASKRILGLCVATGGPTNEDDGSIAYLPRYHNWPKNAPLKKMLQEKLPENLNIIVNNEMYCQSIGEQYFGKAYGKRSALVFEAGDKSGSGIIMDKHLLSGAHSIAGEIGHIKLDAHSDVQCVCGAYGCFRALVHSDRIVSLVREGLATHPDSILHSNDHLTAIDVFGALEAGDGLACEVMEQMAQWMGMAISNLILTIDPEIIVLQGIYTGAGPVYLDMLRRHVVRNKFPYLKELKLAIEYSALGSKACILGGSKLITEAVINQYCKQD